MVINKECIWSDIDIFQDNCRKKNINVVKITLEEMKIAKRQREKYIYEVILKMKKVKKK